MTAQLRPTPVLRGQRKTIKRTRVGRTVEAPIEDAAPSSDGFPVLKLVKEADRRALAKARRDYKWQQRDRNQRTKEAPIEPEVPLKTNPPLVDPKDDGFNGVVPRLYEGRPAVIMATGPSLTEAIVEAVRPYHADGSVVVFGCNDAYRACDFLDVHYACDPPWWDHHVKHADVMDHPAVKWTQDEKSAAAYGVNHIKGESGNGFCKSQSMIFWGQNSGFQVMNLAYLYGVSRMILLGYNMGVPSGRMTHFFGDHPQGMNSKGNSYASFVDAFATIAGADRKMIVNCTHETRLECFQKGDLLRELEACRNQSHRAT